MLVLYPDYGQFNLIKIDDIQPLPLEFWELPYQALRCKLHGKVYFNPLFIFFFFLSNCVIFKLSAEAYFDLIDTSATRTFQLMYSPAFLSYAIAIFSLNKPSNS